MLLVACVLAVSVLAGWAAGGRLRNLGHVELRAMWLVFVAAGLQGVLAAIVLAGGPAALWSRPLLAGSHVALAAFVLANHVRPGMLLVLAGLLLNALVIGVNGAMPVAGDALALAGGNGEVEAGKHRLLVPGDRLPLLADVIPLPPLRTVVSAGDVVLATGVGLLVLHLMRREPRRPGSRLRPVRPSPLARLAAPLARPRARPAARSSVGRQAAVLQPVDDPRQTLP